MTHVRALELLQVSKRIEAKNIGAWISEDKRHRYMLWRIWDRYKPLMLVAGLNPSTADHEKEDPTSRRIKSFVESWGYGGYILVNVYAYRATDPKDMFRNALDPVGPFNLNAWGLASLKTDEQTLVGWGGNAEPSRALALIRHLEQCRKTLMCLGHTAKGHPKHPLYIKGETPLIPYDYNRLLPAKVRT